MYGIEQGFWLKLIILLIISGLLIVSFHALLRRLLKVEKKKLFSTTYINETHKKVDRILRMTIVTLILSGLIIRITRFPMKSVWYLEPWFFLCLLVVSTESVRAYMEWKYTPNKNSSIFTISQLSFFILLMVGMFFSDFFGLM